MRKLIILTALIFLIFLTSCKTTTVYVYPDFIHPEIDEQPTKTYVDGGFQAVDGGQFISTADAKILVNYLISLKEWGSEGWLWITDFYIKELDRLKDKLPE